MILVIFGSYEVFFKSLGDHFFPNEILPNPLEEFADKNDVKHKINMLYASILGMGGGTFLIYTML